MMKTLRRVLPALILGASVSACSGPSGPGDGRNDSFGGSLAKADSEFTACQLSEVLALANESGSTADALEDMGLSSDAALAIAEHRAGPDGQPGTGDDDIYDDLDELDAVDFVGPVALDFMVAAVLDRCEVDLETRPFINQETFGGSTGGGFTRDDVELEAAMRVTGITGQALNSVLSEVRNDRSNFARVAKVRLMEAFTYGFDIEEMPWNSDSHNTRELLPFVPLTIEFDRYRPDADGGERELRFGTDTMDDIYYDSFDYRLLRHDISTRGRIRWDGPGEVRRLLIAAKFGATVDANGIKRAAKVDVRTEGGTHVPEIDDDVRRGKVAWNGSDTPIEPIREVYDRLMDAGSLPTIGQHENVLILDPKVHIRSTRSRWHYNLASMDSMRGIYTNGLDRVDEFVELLDAAIARGDLSATLQSEAEELAEMGRGLSTGDLVKARAEAELGSGTELRLPLQFRTSASDREALAANKVVADINSELMHEFSERFDDMDREIIGSAGLDFDDFVDMFIEWRKAEDSSLQIKRTYRPFVAEYRDLDSDRDQAISDFNEFAEQQVADGNDDFEDFETVDGEIWDALGKHLAFEDNKEGQRQIESAGTMGRALWFDQARAFFVPASSRPFGNFMIDTVDMAQMLTREEWISIPEDDRSIEEQLAPEKIFHTALVNEVQIELGTEAPYVARIAELQALIDDGSATDADREAMEGATMVFSAFRDALTTLASVKGEHVLDKLRDNGAPSTVQWGASESSKGQLALQLLADFI